MVGEREEELEAMKAELDEVKEAYRLQLEALMLRLAAAAPPPPPPVT